MRAYESPELEIIELRPEERLAMAYMTGNSNGKYTYTIFDNDTTDDKYDYFSYSDKTQTDFGIQMGATKKAISDFLKTLGF